MFSKKTTVKLMFPAFALGAFFAACSNGESISDSKVESVAEADSLPECDSTYEGEMVLVKSDSSIHVCVNKEWTKITQNSDGSYDYDGDKDCSLKQVDINQLQIKCGTDSMTFFVQGNVPISSSSAESASSFELKGALISGNAIKGPFEVNAVATLKEMQIQGDSLSYTGRSFTGSVSGNKGNFIIPNVALDYPYAEVSVTGKWLNEVTGNLSSDEMTLYALVDLSDGSTEVNVNILTHLEYERVKVLVKKGYNVNAAKKQAENEIMSALGFSTDMGYFEKLSAFASGSAVYNEAANATLLAVSLLFIRDNDTDAKIKESLQKFADDIASDGKWNDDDGEKKKMVAWAENYDADAAIENIKAWGILDVPEYGKYLGAFWNNYYGLGSCNRSNDGAVKTAKKNDDGLHFICKNESFWNVATALEWETYGWEPPQYSDFRFKKVESGNVYVYDDEESAWRISKDESEKEIADFTIDAPFYNTVARGSITNRCYVLNEVDKKATVYAFGYYDGSKWSFIPTSELDADTYRADRGFRRELLKGKCTGKYYSPYELGDGSVEFRPATESELYLNYSCHNVSDGTVGIALAHRVSSTKDSIFVCKDNGNWEFLRVDELPYVLLTDSRNGNTYRTITIGTQTWMAEDLNYCLPSKERCSSNLSFSGNEIATEKNICPEGWHIPSSAEFITLLKYVGNLSSFDPEEDNALGYELMSPSEQHAVDGKFLANKFGFSARTYSSYWASDKDPDNSDNGYQIFISNPGSVINEGLVKVTSVPISNNYGRIRCVKNVE